MVKTQYCDECKYRYYMEEGPFHCLKNHKPRFYQPKNGNVYSDGWGYKRRCSDFVVGDHVKFISLGGDDEKETKQKI